jgi:hypothetical protein
MTAGNQSSIAISGDSFPGASYVGALEDYTKRIETSVGELETQVEGTLTRVFAIFIFLMMIGVAFPLMIRLTSVLQGSSSYQNVLEFAMVFSFVGIFGLIFFTVYVRLIRVRRLRRNLETLLWPYDQLLQKLSQTLDHGELNDATSTLVQLKILEAEVAYSRAKRAISSRIPFLFLVDPQDRTLGPYGRDYGERSASIRRMEK